jgi:uncharacterized membrane protein YgdD (TMEM256/DUF423 family)
MMNATFWLRTGAIWGFLAVAMGAFGAHGGIALQVAGWSFLLGSLIFSGSLYILSTTGIRGMGAITPIGGVLMLIGWIALALAAGVPSKPHGPVDRIPLD